MQISNKKEQTEKGKIQNVQFDEKRGTRKYNGAMVWEVLLYMGCFYWLMNKADLAFGRAE